jgi:hypothetical protein
MTSTQLTGQGPQVVAQSLLSSSTTALHNLGELVQSSDGRAYRYALAGATALVAGKLQQAAAQVTGDQNLTAVAAAVGDLALVSTSTVTVTANQYANGYALITVTPGVGYQYKIAGHAAFTAAAPTFTLSDAIQVALTTSSRIDLIKNAFDSVIVSPATASSTPVGVAVYPVAIASYGWLQVLGIANVLADGAITTGTNVIASNAVAGAIEPGADAADLQASVGIAVSGIADTEYGAVKLTLG